MASKIVLDGYTLPEGVWVKTDVQDMQKALGVKIDGVWGPKTQAAYDKYTYERGPTASLAYPGLSLPLGVDTAAGVRAVQKQLGKYQTGLWDYASQNEYDKFIVQNMPKDFDFDFSRYTITPQRAYELDKIGYEWGIGRSDDGDHVMSGYTTPEGIYDREGVKEWQKVLGVAEDGIWGPRTQKAYDRLLEMGIQAMQTNTQTSGTNTQQSNGQAPWQTMVYTEKPGGNNPTLSKNVLNGQDAPIAARQALNASTKEQTPQEALRQLQLEKEQQLNIIKDIPAWERTSILGAAPSEKYTNAMQRIREIDKEISNKMKRVGDTMSLETTPDAGGHLTDIEIITPKPTPTPQPTPSPSPTPAPTPTPVLTEKEFLSDLKTFNSQKAANDSYMFFTVDQLKQIWKNADSDTANGLNWAIRKLELDTPKKVLYFLASIYHETGSDRELIQGDSGTTKHRGGGYIHVSGPDNYKSFSEAMNDREILNQGAKYVAENYAWESAVWYWKYGREINRVFNYENGGTFEDVTHKVKHRNEDVSPGRQADYEYIRDTFFSEYNIE